MGNSRPRNAPLVEPFGKYVLVRKLAEGGMAEIFLAKQTGIEGIERNVVIKRMLPHISRQQRFVDMFLDEARVAARLIHPNVMPIYEVGLVGETYYICMEYLPGADLAWMLQRALEQGRQLPIEVALRIIVAAARGLDYAHSFAGDDGQPLNIVHRDVSPANLYVSFEGQVKVLDFGIAKAESRITTTRTGTVKGKTQYMAPEQSRAEPVDRRSDVYALGVTLYEALTVWPPFARGSVAETMDAILRGEFRAPRTRRPEIPGFVERAVLKAMALDAADRYPSCGALADELEAALASPAQKGPDPLIGAFLRELAGDEVVTGRSRIPSLEALAREAAAARRAGRVRALVDGAAALAGRAWRPRTAAWVALAVGLAVAAAGVFAEWRAHRRSAPPRGCEARYGADASDAITIGATLPLSVDGKLEDGQLQLLDALRLALDEINQRDGVAGRRFALRACDNAGDLARLQEQVRWLADVERVPALITSWSSLTLAAVNLTVPRGVLTITADATSPELSAVPALGEGGARLLWRTSPSDASQAELAAQLIAGDPAFAGVHRVGVLYQDDPYGQGWAGVLEARLPEKSPSLEVHAIQFPFRGDVRSAVAQLAQAQPELTVLVCFPLDATRILNLAAQQPALTRAHGHRWFFSDSIKEPSLFNGLTHPEEIDGARGIESADGGGIEAAQFQERFAARFRRRATDQTYASNRYDAMYVLALGAAWAAGRDGTGAITGARIAQGLTHLSSGPRFPLTPERLTAAKALLQAGGSIDVVGASGALDFDPATGEAPASFQLWRIAGHGFIKERRLAGPAR